MIRTIHIVPQEKVWNRSRAANTAANCTTTDRTTVRTITRTTGRITASSAAAASVAEADRNEIEKRNHKRRESAPEYDDGNVVREDCVAALVAVEF